MATLSKPFRFLDLPAELRNRVYEQVMIEEHPMQVLAYLRLPQLCSVSQQIRREVMPVFFAETRFEIHAGSDFSIRARRACISRPYKSGQLVLSPRVATVLLNSMRAVRIRHVIYRISTSSGEVVPVIHELTNPSRTEKQRPEIILKRYQQWMGHLDEARDIHQYFRDNLLIAEVSLDLRGATMEFTSSPGLAHPDRCNFSKTFKAKEVDEAVQALVSKANSISEEEGFKGFTVEDSQSITRELQYAPDSS